MDSKIGELPISARPDILQHVRSLVSKHWAEIVAVIALLLMATNLVSNITRKSITNDEVIHIPAGYCYLTNRDFRLNNEHPPLAKMCAAVPLLFMNLKRPAAEIGSSKDLETRSMETAVRFWQINRADFQRISFWARLPMVVLTLALGLLIFVYARTLFGRRAAAFAVVFFSLEPTVLAHGRVVHTDVAAAFAFLGFFAVLHYYWRAPAFQRALLLGLVSGLVFVTKFSTIVIAPVLIVALVLLLFRPSQPNLKRKAMVLQSVIIVVIVLLVVNAAYFFQRPVLSEPDALWFANASPLLFSKLMIGVRLFSYVLPSDFLLGLFRTKLHNDAGHPAGLLGQYRLTGWWYYFPVAFALKTSLPFLVLSLAALIWGVWEFLGKKNRMFFALLLPIVGYAVFSMTSHVNIGVRHFLPVFPFLFILAGGFLDQVISRNKNHLVLLLVLIAAPGWMALEAVRAYPDYMSYMNQLTWQHPRWYYLSDSNVEWGDDVRSLAEYLQVRGEKDVRAALSGGWVTLGYYGVNYIGLPARPGHPLPNTHYVAIGAGFLNGSTVPRWLPDSSGNLMSEEERVNLFAAYRNRTPEAVFGNSIYLYREKE